MSQQSRRVRLAELDRKYQHFESMLVIVSRSKLCTDNPKIIALFDEQIKKIEAELLDIEIKRTFPDYIPPWERK